MVQVVALARPELLLEINAIALISWCHENYDRSGCSRGLSLKTRSRNTSTVIQGFVTSPVAFQWNLGRQYAEGELVELGKSDTCEPVATSAPNVSMQDLTLSLW